MVHTLLLKEVEEDYQKFYMSFVKKNEMVNYVSKFSDTSYLTNQELKFYRQ